jgi:hypothetical protein
MAITAFSSDRETDFRALFINHRATEATTRALKQHTRKRTGVYFDQNTYTTMIVVYDVCIGKWHFSKENRSFVVDEKYVIEV